MPTMGEVAKELRRLAGALDREPDTEVVQPTIYFSCRWKTNAKELFLSIARLLPRPFTKMRKSGELWLCCESPALEVRAYVEQEKVCRLVKAAQPAEYECEPLLSEDEEKSLVGA